MCVLVQVKRVVSYGKHYKFGSGRTNYALEISLGRSQKTFRLDHISNSRITQVALPCVTRFLSLYVCACLVGLEESQRTPKGLQLTGVLCSVCCCRPSLHCGATP